MTSGENLPNNSLVSPENAEALAEHVDDIYDNGNRKYQQDLLASTAFADGRMRRDDELPIDTDDENIIGELHVLEEYHD